MKVRTCAKNSLVFIAPAILPFFFQIAYSADEDVLDYCNQPDSICTKPVPKAEWKFSGPYYIPNWSADVQENWCNAKGGEYGGWETPTCEGEVVVTADNAAQIYLNYMKLAYPDYSDTCAISSDSGWGFNIPGHNLFEQRFNSGVLVRDVREVVYGGCNGNEGPSATIHLLRGRGLECPLDSKLVNTSSGDLCLRQFQMGSCSEGNPKVGNPIEALTGRKVQKELDIDLPKIKLNRFYSSDSFFIPGSVEDVDVESYGMFGFHWSHSFQYKMFFIEEELGSFVVREPNGDFTYFDDKGAFSTGVPGRFLEIVSADHYRYHNRDGYIDFNHTGKALGMFDGQRYLNFVYGIYDDGDEHLSEIKSSEQTYLTFSYKRKGRIAEVIAYDGTKAEYTYNEKTGNLVSVSIGEQRRNYHYDEVSRPSALTSVVNVNGETVATWFYSLNGQATTSFHGANKESYSLDFTDNFKNEVLTTNPLGKNTRYHYEIINGLRKVTEVVGEPSENCAASDRSYQYYDDGTLKSKTDWEGNLTTYIRDEFGREVSRIEASGTLQARTITTVYNPALNKPSRIIENDFVTDYSYDLEGRLLNTTKTVINKAAVE